MAILKGGSYVGGDFIVANNLIAGGTLTSTGNIYTNGAVYTNGKANTGDEDLSGLATYSYVNNTFLSVNTGGTVNGNLKVGNTTIYSAGSNGNVNSMMIGDDVTLGDCNVSGSLGMKSNGTNTGFRFLNSSGTNIGDLQSIAGILKFNTKTIWDAGNSNLTSVDWSVRALTTNSTITMPINQQIRWADNTSMIYGTANNLNFTGTGTFSSNVNAVGYGNFGTTRANAYLKLYGLTALAGYDNWLKINDGDGFTNGIYCGTKLLRTDGIFHIGENGGKVLVDANGHVGIGITGATSVLHVVADSVCTTDPSAAIFAGNKTTPAKRVYLGYDGTADIGFIGSVHTGIDWKNLVINPGGGNVGIGTSTIAPSYKLDIAGTLRSSGVANFNNSLYTTGNTYTTGGFLAGGNIYSGGKTDLNDGIHGVMLSKAGGIEISGGSPLIDFHFNNSTNDFTSRIIEIFSGQLSFDSKIRIGDIYTQNPNNEALYVNGNICGTGEIKTNTQFTYGTYAYSKYNTITKSIDFIFN